LEIQTLNQSIHGIYSKNIKDDIQLKKTRTFACLCTRIL